MPRRFSQCFAVPLSLVAVLAVGCSRAGDSKPGDKAVPGTRPIAAIWADVLGQRDTIHSIFTKDLESVTHEDCAALGASARRVDELTTELVSHVGGTSGQSDTRLRALGDAIARMAAVFAKVRETALSEAPGAFVNLRYPVDQSLRQVESYFSADDLGNESVLNRPGFETQPPPPAASPI